MKKNNISPIIVCVMALLTLAAPRGFAADDKKNDKVIEKKVDEAMRKLSISERIDLLGEYKGGFSIRPIPALGIPEIKMADASIGVRNYGKSTQYPASVVGASTWNRRIIYGMAGQLAEDCKARGVRVLLGPGLNIMRAPVCGRNFEYLSEDPYLTSEIGVSFIKGLQNNGVAAVAKHFALNNMEWGRKRIDSRVDERTCHEIYFPAFRAAVQDADVAMVMDSYNLVNGVYATENLWLNERVLRKMWGFKGLVMSDWGATHNTAAAIQGGLDLDMDGKDRALYFNRDSLLAAIDRGAVTMEMVDVHVRNILRTIYRYNLDLPVTENGMTPFDDPKSDMIALREAEEGIVLLKNKNKMLPLQSKTKSVMVVGPFADKLATGGGSSRVTPYRSVTLYEGMQRVMPKLRISKFQKKDHQRTCEDFYQERGGRRPGLKVEYFNNSNLGGTPLYAETVEKLDFDWGKGSPNEEILGQDNFSMRYTGYLRVPESGEYSLLLSSDDCSRLWIDGHLKIDNWNFHSFKEEEVKLELKAGRDYAVRVEYAEAYGDAALRFGYRTSDEDDGDLAGDAAKSDAVIVTAGFGQSIEKEGIDRPWELPEDQVAQIKAMAKENSNVIVVLFTGGAVDVSSWIDDVRAVVWAGYPGQQGGYALAEILSGKVNPSGRLTSTWARRWNDYSSANNYYEVQGQDYLNYQEGLLVGYRSFDKKNVEPMFPFGFGLSYTKFSYGKLEVKRGLNGVQVKVEVTNSGKQTGSEVVQVYVSPENVQAGEPVQALRGFEKVSLQPGQKKTITLLLNNDSFSTYKIDKKAFTMNYGSYNIKVGASSRDIRLTKKVKIERPATR